MPSCFLLAPLSSRLASALCLLRGAFTRAAGLSSRMLLSCMHAHDAALMPVCCRIMRGQRSGFKTGLHLHFEPQHSARRRRLGVGQRQILQQLPHHIPLRMRASLLRSTAARTAFSSIA